MSEESLLYDREEERMRKEGVYQEDTWVKGIPLDPLPPMPPVSLLQVYILFASITSQVIYLCRAAVVKCLHLTWSISPHKHKFFLTSTLFRSSPYFCYFCLPLFLLYTPGSSSRPCISSLVIMYPFPEFEEIPPNATCGHFRRFRYVIFGRGGCL